MEFSERQQRVIDLKASFKRKDDFLSKTGIRLDPAAFYAELFGNAEPEREMTHEECKLPENLRTGRGNLLVVGLRKLPEGGYARSEMRTRLYNRATASQIPEIYKDNPCALIAPVEWYGRTCKGTNARYIHAIVIDLDYVDVLELDHLTYEYTAEGYIPAPTFIANSGTGLHLYYQFDEPLKAYPPVLAALKKLKHGMIRRIWNNETSRKHIDFGKEDLGAHDPRQYQGPIQGYRVIGSLTKLGAGYHVSVFRTGKVIQLEDWNEYLAEKEYRISDADLHYKGGTGVTLDEARQRWPEWYQRRIVEKLPQRGYSCCAKLFQWWLGQVKQYAKAGHRYHCIATLAAYGVKCGVPKDQVMAAALALVPDLDRRGKDRNARGEYETGAWDHFTAAEARKAVTGFYAPQSRTITKKQIMFLSGIDIRSTNIRKGRPQKIHLKTARAVEEILNPDWRDGNGRKPKAAAVAAWRRDHPNGNKSECSRDTGMSRVTVTKWWNAPQGGKP